MFKNKLLNIMLLLIGVVTLAGAIALIFILNYTNDSAASAEPTIDDIIEVSVETDKITTNLLDDNHVMIQFNMQTESVKAKEELKKRQFQVRNMIIQELSSMTSDQLRGEENLKLLEKNLKLRVNEVMQEGTIEKVYTIDFVIQ